MTREELIVLSKEQVIDYFVFIYEKRAFTACEETK